MPWMSAPICDSCWATLEPDRTPVRSVPRVPETCHRCGFDTQSGIYIRAFVESSPQASPPRAVDDAGARS